MGSKVTKSGTLKELTPKDIALLKAKSKLSEEDIRKLHAEFWHDFPSGTMDKKGFARYFEEIKEERDKGGVLSDHVFALFDTNHDDRIDFGEFLSAIAAESPGDIDSHLNCVFEMCDVSGDGRMDQKELASFIAATLTITGETEQKGDLDPNKLALDIFNRLGIHGDKKLNKKQFVQGCKQNPALRKLLGGEK